MFSTGNRQIPILAVVSISNGWRVDRESRYSRATRMIRNLGQTVQNLVLNSS